MADMRGRGASCELTGGVCVCRYRLEQVFGFGDLVCIRIKRESKTDAQLDLDLVLTCEQLRHGAICGPGHPEMELGRAQGQQTPARLSCWKGVLQNVWLRSGCMKHVFYKLF